MPKSVAAVVVGRASLFALALISGMGSAEAADCLDEPDGDPPAGSHWYYRVDRTNGQKCWYLREAGLKLRAAAGRKNADTTGSVVEKRVRRSPAPLTTAQREGLFRDFLRWQERNPP